MASASAQGWFSRATNPHPSAPDFTPSEDDLVFAVLLHAQADPEGFTLALFRPDVAVDARGRVLQLEPSDFSALASLAEKAIAFPETGRFYNTWRVEHDITEQKIDRLLVKNPSGHLKQISVQGWDAQRRRLKSAVANYEELPDELQELFGNIQEGRTDYVYDHVDNPDLIAKIQNLVDNLPLRQ